MYIHFFVFVFRFKLKDYKCILQEKLGGVRQPVSKTQTNDR